MSDIRYAIRSLPRARWLTTFMYGVRLRDPAIYGAVIAILLTTAIVAAWIPAGRAARLDPADVLRVP